jgi:general secretion pathway protein D
MRFPEADEPADREDRPLETSPARRVRPARTSTVIFGLLFAGFGAFVVHTVLGPFGGNPVDVRAANDGETPTTGGAPFPTGGSYATTPKPRPWFGSATRSPSSSPSPDRDEKKAAKHSDSEAPRGAVARNVRLMFLNSDWSTILNKVAASAGATLVMQEVPPGRFSRYDRKKYTLTEAVRVLNRELEPKGFRLVEKSGGRFLDVMFLRSARAEYYRPQLPNQRRSYRPYSRLDNKFGPVRKLQRSVQTITPRRAGDRHGSAVQTASHSSPGRDVGAFPPLHEVEDTVVRVVATRNRPALEVARAIYKPLKSRSKLLNSGPSGLPAFEVFPPDLPAHRAVRQVGGRAKVSLFTIAIDSRRDELTVKAPKTQCEGVIELIRYLDAVDVKRGETVRVVAPNSNAALIAKTLRPQLALLVQAGKAAQPREQPPQPAGKQPAPKGEEGIVFPVIRGRVTIREINGQLVVTGNKEDVEAVLRIIRELDRQGLITAPNIKVHFLKHVNSQALADLLTNVYRQLTTLRTGATAQQPGTVAFLPVVRPNALLIISSRAELPTIEKLIEEQLDRPVDPEKEYRVFHLKSAIASQVVANIGALSTGTGTGGTTTPGAAPAATATQGLATRVRLIADVRTNTVIVEANPNDMKVVAHLIEQLDSGTAPSVSRVRIFRLKNAVAGELATLINNAIQSVINPAPQPTAGGGAIGTAAVGASGGQNAQLLREVKSSILEFMVDDAGRKRLIRSGILADIRVTPDPRVNALVVAAPETSMPLMESLIHQLDSPSALIAEIKVFTLVNGDATSMLTLLQTLFPTQQAGAAGNAPLGVQIASADDASSGLIPLRFSVDPRTNSIIAVGGAGALSLVEAVIFRLDERDSRQRQTTVVKMRNAPVTDVANAINQFLTSQRNLYQIDPNIVTNLEILEREIIVVPEPVSNSLLISSTPRFFEEIKRIVQKLDAAPPQVVIQALIVEVQLDNTDEFGVELGFQEPLLFDRGFIASSDVTTLSTTQQNASGISTTSQQIIAEQKTPGFNFNNQPLGTNIAANPSAVAKQALSNFALGRVNGDLGFGGLVLSAQSSSVSVLLRALAAKRTVQILSRPQVTALDNQLATINVGQTVPRTQGVTLTAVGSANPTVADTQVGIGLSVTPRIRDDGSIVMQVIATSSSLSNQGVPIFTDATNGNVVTSPIINNTSIQTTVAIPSGQTIVLGGLITKSDDTIERKVPWLGDLPIVKYAFRYDSTVKRRTELLVFLTPRIVRDDADSEVIKQIEAERMHFIEKDAEQLHGPLYSVPSAQRDGRMPTPVSTNRRSDGRVEYAGYYGGSSVTGVAVPSHKSSGGSFLIETRKESGTTEATNSPYMKKSGFSLLNWWK